MIDLQSLFLSSYALQGEIIRGWGIADCQLPIADLGNLRFAICDLRLKYNAVESKSLEGGLPIGNWQLEIGNPAFQSQIANCKSQIPQIGIHIYSLTVHQYGRIIHERG